MTEPTLLAMGNLAPMLGGSLDAYLGVWKEIASYFERSRTLELLEFESNPVAVTFSLDASDCLAFLEAIGDSERIAERGRQREAQGRHWLTSELQISFEGATLPPDLSGYASDRILQSLFLASNLSVPGSCAVDQRARGREGTEWLERAGLYGDEFEASWLRIEEWGWGPWAEVTFGQAWRWLQALQFHNLQVARKAVEKALLLMLVVSEGRAHEDMVLRVAQAYEGLLTEGKQAPASVIRARIESLLGSPPTHKRWWNKFYSLRSKVAHGGHDWLRPGPVLARSEDVEAHHAEFMAPLDRAFGVLLGLIRALIDCGGCGFSFAESASVVPLVSR